MAKNLSEGSKVRYYGDLPEGWGPGGIVVAVENDASGDQIATIEFDLPGRVQDILASELERDVMDAQHCDDEGNPF